MEIKEVIHNAKTKKTKIINRKLSEQEITEKNKVQKQIEDELLKIEYLEEKEKEKNKAQQAEFEEWKKQNK